MRHLTPTEITRDTRLDAKQIAFEVDGRPQQRGSKRAFASKNGGRPRMVDDNAKSGPWMDAVAHRARVAMLTFGEDTPLLDGPLRLWAVFRFKRPKAHYLKSGLRADAPQWHTSTPDTDKLTRAIGDAMTGVVYGDDKQIADVLVSKVYTESSEGVSITVQQL
jgi:crossover junction endodeoxyribonuclease RusA